MKQAHLNTPAVKRQSAKEGSYNLYRYPAMFRDISDQPLENLPSHAYRQQEIELENQGQRIYGITYIPDTEENRVPLVICAHGLGGSYRSNAAYAEQLASHGIAACCFDFRGGGGSKSDGNTTEMSVMTEVSDLEAILEAAAGWDFVDENKIILLGTSQGGIASAIAATRHTDKISGLVLMYPAFLVSDAIHEQFDSLEDVPDSFHFNWITAGRIYAEDMWDYDVYEEIGNYTDKVLLMHGNADGIVPISYSDRAAKIYEDVEYYVIDGAGHGFSGKTIIPFTTHGGSGFSRTIQTISELQPNATVISDGLSISRDSVAEAESDVLDWVNSLNLNAE